MKNNDKASSKLGKSGRYKATGIAAVIAIAVILAVYFSENSSSSSVMTPVITNVIQGIRCEPMEGTIFHVHAHLDVLVNGKSVIVPAGIGIKSSECLYWLHTHDASGIIHIESPQQMGFTLGQFIQVWDNTPGISPKFEELTNGDKNLQIFVNGNKVKNTYDGLTLSPHDEIFIVSGNVPKTIPSSYPFGGL